MILPINSNSFTIGEIIFLIIIISEIKNLYISEKRLKIREIRHKKFRKVERMEDG